MCIALLTTAHPSYKLILIDNRDEYVNRPTSRADWWPAPHAHVLGGRDLLRSVHGTWLGVTRDGRIAVLTNYREDVTPPPTAVSRGEIVKRFLTEEFESVEDWVADVVNSGVARDAGGLSLVCGKVGGRLAVVSNRAASDAQVPWICGDVVETVGLSNTVFEDRSWPKVTEGEELLLRAVRRNVLDREGEDALIERLLDVLNDDALRRAGFDGGKGLEACIGELKKSIFCPPLGRKDMSGLPADEIAAARREEKAVVLDERKVGEVKKLGLSGIYATQRQTVVLVNHENEVRYFERSLWDDDSNSIELGKADLNYRFTLTPAA